MKKWFFRFLNIGLATTAMLALGLLALFYWAVPNPRDIALVPMAMDAATQKGAGFLTNSTGTPWLVYISAYNPSTGQATVTQVWAAIDPLQAVSYSVPAMKPSDPIELRIIYAKKMARRLADETSPRATTPSYPSLPSQSRPWQPGPVPTAPAPKEPAP